MSADRDFILIIDDNPDNLRVAVDLLEAYSFLVRTARDGETGIRRARVSDVGLILLDIQMPGIDGYETCRRLKADPALADILVIFMTSRAGVDDKVRAFELGGVDYVTKPFEAPELLARVRTQLRLRSLQRQLNEQNQRLHSEVADQRQNLGSALASRQQIDAEMGRLVQLVNSQSEEFRAMSRRWAESQGGRLADPAASLRAHQQTRLGLVASNLRQATAALPEGPAAETSRHHLDLAASLLAPLLTDAVDESSVPSDTSALVKLSERERLVLKLLAQGKTTSDIAAELDVAVSTVSTYRRRIREKTGAETIGALIALQMQQG